MLRESDPSRAPRWKAEGKAGSLWRAEKVPSLVRSGPRELHPQGSKAVLSATPSWWVVSGRGRLDVFSLMVSHAFVSFHPVHSCNPSSNQTLSKVLERGPLPKHPYCAHLKNGNSESSILPHSGEWERETAQTCRANVVQDSLRIPLSPPLPSRLRPTDMELSPSFSGEGHVLAPACLTQCLTFLSAAITDLAAFPPGEQP